MIKESKMILSGNIPIEKRLIAAYRNTSQDVTVSWTWYNESEGVVSWNFENASAVQKSVILFRSGYYFGNAFWPVYVENDMTSWIKSLTPLIDQGVENNTMPIGIIDFGGGNKIIAFIFTLAAGQKWSVLEGGFSSISPPSSVMVFDVTLKDNGSFCIGYDPQQVLDWDVQTGSTMQGYSPNPSNITTLEMTPPAGAQYVQLFPKDSVTAAPCSAQPSNCLQEIEQGINQGNIDLFFEGILCALDQMGYSFRMILNKLWDKALEDLKKKL